MRGLLALSIALAACEPVPADRALPLGSDSASCGACHDTHYDEWRGSPHAAAESSPVLAAMLPIVESSWGQAARATCEGCHAPRHGGDADLGIGCVSCHAAVGNRAERDGMLVVDPGVPLSGPLPDAEPSPAHRTHANEFLGSASLCGTCHEITGPRLVNEPTLTEFRAFDDAGAGLTCADCHMPREPDRVLTRDGSRMRQSSSHRFVGFDPPWGASPAEAARAAERTRAMLAAALELRVEPWASGVRVVVTNVGAAHAVPTGATFLRDLWVDVEQGGVVVASRVIVLGDQPMRGDVPVPLLTDADRVEHASLAPGDARELTLAMRGPLTVVLRGRAIRPAVLDAIGLAHRSGEVPTHEIARASMP